MSAQMSNPIEILVPVGTKTAEIQQIIDNAPRDAIVTLAAGDFVVTETIRINRSDITFRGAGEDETRLIQSTVMEGAPVIKIGPEWVAATKEPLPALELVATAGARMIRFEDNHGLKAGDVVYITQQNTPELFASIGDTEWQQDAPLRTFMATVERVGGNSVALTERLPFDFDPAITTVERMNPLTDVTVGGFEVANTYGTANASSFRNTISEEYRSNTIDISNTVGLTVEEVTITQPASNGINIAASLAAAFSDVTIAGAHNKGSGGNGYAIQIRDVYYSEFTDLVIYDTRHGVLFSSYQTAVGNYVEVKDTNRDINFHGGLDRDNTVIVDESLRSAVEQTYLSASVYFNEGESWGAPTDPTQNTVVFRQVNGTVREDKIVAHDDGGWIAGYEGPDKLYGGQGDDFIFGETGHDVIYASKGADIIDGGSGKDRFVLTGEVADYTITEIEDGFVFYGQGGVARVEDVEIYQFADMTVSEGALGNML